MVGIFEGQTELEEFVGEKTEIEGGVVGDQGVGADEVVKIGEDLGCQRLLGEHFVADAVDSTGPPGDGFVDLDEALEFVGQAAVFDANGANFNDQITSLGRESGGFKVKNNVTLQRLHELIGSTYSVTLSTVIYLKFLRIYKKSLPLVESRVFDIWRPFEFSGFRLSPE